MSSYMGVHVSDQWLQSQFTQAELRSLKSKVSLSSWVMRLNYLFVINSAFIPGCYSCLSLYFNFFFDSSL